MGDRARKLDQGILITRFELPFNIWWYVCLCRLLVHDADLAHNPSGTCNNHIGMGVRYNAEKKKIGAYYSTPIFSFRCKCHLCDGWFEIQTDPKVRCVALSISGFEMQISADFLEHPVCGDLWCAPEGRGLESGGEWGLCSAWLAFGVVGEM